VPLHCGRDPLGIMNLYRKRFTGFTARDYRIATAFAEQAAMAIFNARLYDSIRKNYLDTVRALTQAIEAKDPLTFGHSERVAEIAVAMAHVIDLSEEEVQAIEFGALLHDIGKISLDESILSTPPEYLSVDDRMMLEMHPMIGKTILEPIEFLHPSIPIVLYHHEHWNGDGYPEGLLGEQTPLLARIVTVANEYDHACHRSLAKDSPEEGMIFMREGAGKRYDARLVDVLEAALRSLDPGAPSEDEKEPPSEEQVVAGVKKD
jgi:putative nucleotidyltransferase with HDIG domain